MHVIHEDLTFDMSIDAASSIAQIAMTGVFFFRIALFILLALIKVEDDFRERVSRLVNLYQVLAKFAVIGLLISSLIVIGVYPASSLFQFPPSLESPLIAMPVEAIFLMFFVLVLLLLVLLMRIGAVWVYTTIETKAGIITPMMPVRLKSEWKGGWMSR